MKFYLQEERPQEVARHGDELLKAIAGKLHQHHEAGAETITASAGQQLLDLDQIFREQMAAMEQDVRRFLERPRSEP